MTTAVDGCLWISPGHVGPGVPPTSGQKFAATMASCCDVVVVGLQVWELGPTDPYDLTTEIAAVRDAAADRGWRRYHLFGFSAGATVALATALAHPEEISTLALFEPAVIGDDNWSPVERRWRHELSRVRLLPVEQRQPAFRRMLMMPGEPLPSELGPPPLWIRDADRLEDALAMTGFNSGDLGGVPQPTLAMSGSLSHPRFVALVDRLVDVMPHASAVTFPGCSHLRPPHRVARGRLQKELMSLWER